MTKYIIQHDREGCIGCAACTAVAPDYWEMKDDGKSEIKGNKKKKGKYIELEIDDKDYNANKEAAESCPVNVIHLIKKDTNEKII